MITIYVGCANHKHIEVLHHNPSEGRLDHVQTAKVPGPTGPSRTSMPLARARKHSLLYAGIRCRPYSTSSFRIDPANGRLDWVATAYLDDEPVFLSTDMSDSFLLVASYSGSSFIARALNPDGTFGPTAIQRVDSDPKAHSVHFEQTNGAFYAACLDGPIRRYRFNALTDRPIQANPSELPTRLVAGSRHLASRGRYLYVVNEHEATVSVFELQDQTAAEIQVLSLLDNSWTGNREAADIHLTPDGRFLYASERASNSLSGFRVDASTGKLEPLGRWETEAMPRSFAINSDGSVLAVAGQLSNSVSVSARFQYRRS